MHLACRRACMQARSLRCWLLNTRHSCNWPTHNPAAISRWRPCNGPARKCPHNWLCRNSMYIQYGCTNSWPYEDHAWCSTCTCISVHPKALRAARTLHGHNHSSAPAGSQPSPAQTQSAQQVPGRAWSQKLPILQGPCRHALNVPVACAGHRCHSLLAAVAGAAAGSCQGPSWDMAAGHGAASAACSAAAAAQSPSRVAPSALQQGGRPDG